MFAIDNGEERGREEDVGKGNTEICYQRRS